VSRSFAIEPTKGRSCRQELGAGAALGRGVEIELVVFADSPAAVVPSPPQALSINAKPSAMPTIVAELGRIGVV
jgi:hypothetical protein